MRAKGKHAEIPCLGNSIKQSHRGSKQRCYPPLVFVSFASAKRFCQAYDEVRQFYRPVSEWRNPCRYLIDENIFYSELMRCK